MCFCFSCFSNATTEQKKRYRIVGIFAVLWMPWKIFIKIIAKPQQMRWTIMLSLILFTVCEISSNLWRSTLSLIVMSPRLIAVVCMVILANATPNSETYSFLACLFGAICIVIMRSVLLPGQLQIAPLHDIHYDFSKTSNYAKWNIKELICYCKYSTFEVLLKTMIDLAHSLRLCS